MEGGRAIADFVDEAVTILSPFASESWAAWDRGVFVDAYAPSARRRALDAVVEARRALAADPDDVVLESDLEVALLSLEQVEKEARQVKEETPGPASGAGPSVGHMEVEPQVSSGECRVSFILASLVSLSCRGSPPFALMTFLCRTCRR